MASVAKGKRAAAFKAIDDHIKDGSRIGIGSGSTIVFAVERLAERVKNEKLSVRCVPTSFQAKELIISNGLVLSNLETDYILDVAIDGADEVDKDLNLIKGGGGCQTQEKIVAFAAKKFIVIADDSKKSEYLGEKWKTGLPIEVLQIAHKVVKTKIESSLGGTADLRIAQKKAGPVVTDNGNLILDWKFDAAQEKDWSQINGLLKAIPGVVETGLFVGMTSCVYFGSPNGEISTINLP